MNSQKENKYDWMFVQWNQTTVGDQNNVKKYYDITELENKYVPTIFTVAAAIVLWYFVKFCKYMKQKCCNTIRIQMKINKRQKIMKIKVSKWWTKDWLLSTR